MRFKHGKTEFPLTGQHTRVDCRSCHQTMVFSEASPQCISCHTDIHQMTAGNDCARCHTTENWLVDKVSELHQDNGFPLLGSHALAACVDCHTSETVLRFDRIGNDCNNCHQSDYAATTQPNHSAAGFSTNCSDCHDLSRFDWNTNKVKHDFFPLTKGHDIADCATCHTTGSYANTPSDCISCHTTEYQTATNPNHVLAGFSQNCVDCHTTDKDWMPAKYTQHDVEYFPIYSGEHQGEWNQCTDCHTNPSNFAEFTCITCHTNPETNNDHNGISGYSYNSPACLACHPNGSEDDAFDHNNTQFPLKGAHTTTACVECHANGYAGTPTNCAACHTPDYNQTTNPNHVTAQFSTDCKSCHSETAWMPATFNHNLIYPLNGAHTTTACNACHINGNYSNTPTTCAGCHTPDYNQTTNPNHVTAQFSTDCKSCHSETAWTPATFNHNSIYPLNGAHATTACNACHINGNYSNTPTTCVGCHQSDFNQTTNPNHTSAQFPTDCKVCHSETAWDPANYNHDAMYFPIYSGKHKNEWDQCTDCHTTPGNYEVFSCTVCHTSQSTNNDHQDVSGYVYSSPACFTCHPNGD
ncbi:MAG: cytochrome c3 family protein [Saprospiraceae bacterium]|nr:cytochrome c3 family protein [Saprospiraceae bacterium]